MGGSGRPPNPPNVRGAPAQPGPPSISRGSFEGSGRLPSPSNVRGVPAQPGPPSISRGGSGGSPTRSLEPLLALLQLADGLFPAGGFAHSLGLESYVQAGMVRDAAGVAAFLGTQLE